MTENRWRADFPIFQEKIYGKPLVYLDSAATSQMPWQVIERVTRHYTEEHANVHRGLHYLSERSTEAMEETRQQIARWIGADGPDCIVFTHGATDSIHLAAGGMADSITAGSAVLVTELEHHSNYVPWQQLCLRKGAEFLVCPACDGELDLKRMELLLREHDVRLVAVGQVTNLTGTVNPLERIIPMAHRYGARVLVDGAQGILHQGVDVQALDADYYVFSGHKMLAPTGVGVLYGKRECLEELQPIRFGGGMVDIVTAEKTTWRQLPQRLEAGTPDISGIIGLGEAVRYLQANDQQAMHTHEKALMDYLEISLQKISCLRILGHPRERSGSISFAVEGCHPYDIAGMLDKMGVAVRSGHLCAQPALASLGETAAVRASVAFYNTREDIDALCGALEKVIAILRSASGKMARP